MTSGRIPARLASMAVAKPVGPAPMQIMSYAPMRISVCRESSTMGVGLQGLSLRALSLLEGPRPFLGILSRRRIGFRRGSLELCQDFAQRRNQLIARNMTFLELNPKLECLRRRLELKD